MPATFPWPKIAKTPPKSGTISSPCGPSTRVRKPERLAYKGLCSRQPHGPAFGNTWVLWKGYRFIHARYTSRIGLVALAGNVGLVVRLPPKSNFPKLTHLALVRFNASASCRKSVRFGDIMRVTAVTGRFSQPPTMQLTFGCARLTAAGTF